MTLTETQPGRTARPDLSFAYLMTGIAIGCIAVSGVLGSIFTPVMVTGSAPWITEVPLASILSVIAGLLLTGLLCKTVKTAFFQPAEPRRASATTTPTVDLEPAAEDATVKLRRLAQLRDSGVITEAEFQAKKDDLLTQI